MAKHFRELISRPSSVICYNSRITTWSQAYKYCNFIVNQFLLWVKHPSIVHFTMNLLAFLIFLFILSIRDMLFCVIIGIIERAKLLWTPNTLLTPRSLEFTSARCRCPDLGLVYSSEKTKCMRLKDQSISLVKNENLSKATVCVNEFDIIHVIPSKIQNASSVYVKNFP